MVRIGANLNRLLIRRLLAGVLLAIILSTATHRHDNVTLASFSRTAIEASSTSNASSAGILTDCSICKLHRQLSTSLIHTTPPVELPVAKLAMTAARAVPYLAPATLSARGRAPPLNSPA
jgi:hypothetical protein